MRVLSTFSGISAASVAWKPLGYVFAGYCEPVAFQCHVLAERCDATAPKYLPSGKGFAPRKYESIRRGSVVNFGDVTAITDDDLRALGQIDVLEGGSPCQAFSISGLRRGLNDDRGNLALAFARLALRMREINGLRFVVWENVKGVLSDETNGFGCLLAALAGGEDPLVAPGKSWPNSGHVLAGATDDVDDVTVAWRVLDSQRFGLAQRRERVFLVASFDPAVDAGSVLFEYDGQAWNPEAGDQAQQEDSGHRQADLGATRPTALIRGDSQASIALDPDVAFCLTAHEAKEPITAIHPNTVGTLCASGAGLSRAAGQGNELDFVVVHPKIVGTLQALKPKGSSGSDLDFTIVHTAAAVGEYVCRRLMPIECERLQGFADDWTNVPMGNKPATDGNRYKALGNSMSVPVMHYIGYRLRRAVENVHQERMAA
ncbi:DNA (cytosine-5-)-methyltransferase [Rhizobium pusense]|uniref:Cytosine-specific methyltransferase n=1 Tax=Agrobacterium pusense TaxID=648995 RepID=A0A6H0ZQT7_9HYPH|nr:DNA (cytosine-5-)-methyltransferase [Agrobacterium pusense]MDH2088546.1 DNA (cytosine-5-)-methyltransferase [Agrobacterium pusense]QIX22583.1 DNA cytosine methyltransferase [Agrobacterium pusense]WCK24492.1 DNA (cytosine-5-)-methyltransferase [Agrobacterium pusense]